MTKFLATKNLFAGFNAIVALLLVAALSQLPHRWWVVDGALGLATLGFIVAVVACLRLKAGWARPTLKVTAYALLGVGLSLTAATLLSASYLFAIGGDIGTGGGVIVLLVTAILFAYLIAFPLAQLVWLEEMRHQAERA